MTDPAGANADQRAYWNEAAGRSWADLQALLDRQMQPLGDAVLAALSPRPGDRVLDVGCGCGQTTFDLARAVGPGGEVLGVDISEPMLAVARDRTSDSGAGPVAFRLADAQTEAFGAQSIDGLFSRFGVMFFEDPPAAFTNLRHALKPGGRLAFVCWRPMAENPMFTAPMAAALKHLPAPPPPEPGAPGPFAFADPERIRALLSGAGFEAVTVDPLDIEISPGPIEPAMTLAQRVGPLGRMLKDNPEVRDAVVADLRTALEAYESEDGQVRLPTATWLVTASAPG